MPTKTLNRHRTKHSYSSLEQRRMLAGDIRVVENVHLFIRGDAADNQFEVVVEDDQLQINGLDGTTINGQESYVVKGATVTDSGVTFEGGLRAHLGPGHDAFAINDVQFESLSLVYGGTGNDRIDVVDSVFSDKATFQTYRGDDSISITGSQFEDTFRTVTLDGEDSVSLSDSKLSGDSIVVTGQGADSIQSEDNHYLGEVNLILPLEGNDTVELTNPVVGEYQLGVFLGNGDDTIHGDLTDSTIEGTIRIAGQAGVDQVPEFVMSEDAAAKVEMSTFESQEVFDGGVGGAANVDGGFDSIEVYHPGYGIIRERFATPVVLNTTESVTSVEWTGTYLNEVIGKPATYDGINFIVEVYEDAGDGAPDSSTVVQFEAGDGNRVESGETLSQRGEFDYPIHEFSADIEYTFEAGKEYFVSIYAVLSDAQFQAGNHWLWGFKTDFSVSESVRRTEEILDQTDTALVPDNDWRNGSGENRRPDIFSYYDFDIRLRT